MKDMSVVYLIGSITRKFRYPGRYRFLHHFFPPEKFRREGVEDFWLSTYDGNLKMICNLGSFIEWNVFFRGYYDPKLSSAIKKLVKQGMTVFDVGANIGTYSLLMAKVAGHTGKVFAFEPNPEVNVRLLNNISANGFEKQIIMCPIALSMNRGTGILHVPKNAHAHRGISSMYEYSNVPTEPIDIVVSTLSDEAFDRKIERLHLIKIDTEGNDVLVLEGAKKIIARDRPIIIFEANTLAHQVAGLSILSAVDELRNLGYTFFTVGLLGNLLKLDQRKPIPDTNIVCLPIDK